MSESRSERLSRIRAALSARQTWGRPKVDDEDVAWLLLQVPTEWPCPNPDDPGGCYCPIDEHLEGA